MNTKATIIKENVSATRRKEIWELGKTQKFDHPTIYIVKPTEPTLSIHGNDPLSKYINEAALPAGTSVIRIDGSKNSGVIYTDSNSILVRIFGSIHNVMSARKEYADVVIKTLAKYDIKAQLSSHHPDANDLVVVVDGREKKFSGAYVELLQSYFSFFITLDFDADAVKNLYLLNTDKFLARGNVKHISDVVTGLRTVNTQVDESIVDEIVASLAARLGWEL